MEQTGVSSTTRSNAGLSNELFHELKTSIRGDVFRPNDPLFIERSKMFNGNVLCTAKAVASPLDAVDVSKIILFCRKHNLSPSVKAGGYGTAGWAINGDIIIDLSRLHDIDIEPPLHHQPTDEVGSSEVKAPLPWTSLKDTPTGGWKGKGKGKAVISSPPSEAPTNINTKPISLTSTILTPNPTSTTSNKRRRSPSPPSSAPHHQSAQSVRDMDGDVSMFSSSSHIRSAPSTILNPALQAFLSGPALPRNPSDDDPNGDGYDEPRRPPAHKRKITTVEDDRIEREKAKEREREKDAERTGMDSLLPEQAERQTSTGSKKSTDSGFGSLGSPSESTSNMSTSTSKAGSGSGSGLMSTSGSGGSGGSGTGTGTEEASNTSTKATTPEQENAQEAAGTVAGGSVQPSISRAASEFGHLGLGLGGGGAMHGSMYASGASYGGYVSDPFGYMASSGGHSSFPPPVMWSGPPGTAGHEHYSPSMSGTASGVGGGSVSHRLMNMADPFAPAPSLPSASPSGGAIENRMANVSGWMDRNASAMMSGAPDPFGYMGSDSNLGVGDRSAQTLPSLTPRQSSHSRGSTPTPTEASGTRAGGPSASKRPLVPSQSPIIGTASSSSSAHASSSSSSHLTSSHSAPVHPPSQLGSGVGGEGAWGEVEPLYKEAYVTFGAGVMAKEVDLWTAEHPLEGKEGPVAVAPANVMDEKRREGRSLGGQSRKVVYHVPFAAHPVGSSIMLLGGFGFLSRLHGLSIDNLVEVEMVLADGRIVVVNEREYPDLWWGIRGAGPTFGVATRYKARAHPIPVVFAGNLIYRFHRATAPSLIRHFRDCVKGAPRELYANVLLTAGPADKDSLVVVQICYVGPKEKGKEFLEAISAWSGERCLLNEVDEKSFLCQQDSVAQVLRAKAGRQWFIRSALVTSLPDDVIGQTVTSFADTPIGCTWLFELAGGAIADYEDTCMPKSQREAAFTVAALHQWDMGINDPRCVETAEEWFKDTIAAVSTGGPIPSFLGRAEPPSRVMASYGENWPRLVELKKKYDPKGMFRNTFWPLAEDAHTVIGPSEHEPRTAQEGGNGEGVNDI